MNILVLNGSPSGDYSITVHTVLYLEKKRPGDCYDYLNVAAKNAYFLHNSDILTEKLNWADLIVFAYPVYTFIAPSQLHRIISLIKTLPVSYSDKYATQITTSKHFYDMTAHRYVADNCHDMGMKVLPGLSADMEDLTKEKGQREAVAFWDHVRWCIDQDIYERQTAIFTAPKHVPATIPTDVTEKKEGTVALVVDIKKGDDALEQMILRFEAKLPYQVKRINIHEFAFAGGCMGCFHCAGDGNCIYKDGFQELLREEIQTCQAIVIGFSIQDHSMGCVFKTYDDRQFCNGHRTVTMGMPFGYLISGNLREEENLRTIIAARAEVGGNHLAGIATNETEPDREIDELCLKLSYDIEHHYVMPPNFYGVGGIKIFRDLIWLMGGMMKADYKFFKAHGQFDFPQKNKKQKLFMMLVGGLMTNPKIMAKAGDKMNEGMISPYKKVIEKA